MTDREKELKTPENETGKEAEEALDRAGITVNKNSIPYDKQPAAITSGIRVGTPIVTSRKMREPEMVSIADLISSILDNPTNSTTIQHVRDKVRALCKKFPVYSEIEV